MVNTFYADPAVGGDGSTTTDDANSTTGLANDGFRLRLVPMFTNVVNIANYIKGLAASVATSASTASTAATSAINAAAAMGTSTTSQTIASSGAQTFTTQSGKNWQVGQFLLVASSASPTNWMLGQVTSYSSTSLQVTMVASNGSGTIASWNISLAAPPSNTVTGAFSAAQTVAFTGDITVSPFDGTFNDWAPTGVATAAVIRAAPAAAVTNLNGITGGTDGRILVLQNTGSFNILLNANAAGSTAANRFAQFGVGQTVYQIQPGECALLMYDATSALWRVVGGASAAAASAIWAGSDFASLVSPGALKNACAFGALTAATTIAWDIPTIGFNARVTLNASTYTLGAPTGLYDGLSISLEIVQDATGGRTLAGWNAIWDFGAAGLPTLQTGANKADRVFGQYNARTGKIECSFRKGA